MASETVENGLSPWSLHPLGGPGTALRSSRGTRLESDLGDEAGHVTSLSFSVYKICFSNKNKHLYYSKGLILSGTIHMKCSALEVLSDKKHISGLGLLKEGIMGHQEARNVLYLCPHNDDYGITMYLECRGSCKAYHFDYYFCKRCWAIL